MAELGLLQNLGVAFFGGFIALVGKELVAHCRRPILVPSADMNKHRVVIIEGPTTYFRLHVLNEGKSTARGCEVAIERLVRTEPTRIAYENDAITLGWSLKPLGLPHIHAKTARFCDIFLVRPDEFKIVSDMTPNYIAEKLADSYRAGARFEVRLRVSAENASPRRINIVCGWERDRRNPFAQGA